MKRKILVTGGAGFVGSNLIEALLGDPNNEIFSLDNYFIGTKSNHKKGARYIEGSTKDIAQLVTFRPDLVFHLGEYSRVEQSFDDIQMVFEFNKIGTFAVLEFCRKHNTKIVYAGSSTKFGDGGLGRDQSPYAWTKASNTELVCNYGKWFGLKYAITYFYNGYGPGVLGIGKYASVIGLFASRTKAGLPLPVVSPGTQVRNFTHVKDIVRGLMLVGDKGEGDNYGLGSAKSYTILEVAKMFGGKIEMLPEKKGNRMTAAIDLSRSHGELGWEAKENLEDYIKNLSLSG